MMMQEQMWRKSLNIDVVCSWQRRGEDDEM